MKVISDLRIKIDDVIIEASDIVVELNCTESYDFNDIVASSQPIHGGGAAYCGVIVSTGKYSYFHNKAGEFSGIDHNFDMEKRSQEAATILANCLKRLGIKILNQNVI